MKLILPFAVLSLVATGQALKCYTCKGDQTVTGGEAVASTDKKCVDFVKSGANMSDFEKECPETSKSCVKVVDPKNSTIVAARGCSDEDKSDCEDGQPNCYCKTDLCNSSDRRWSSAVLLLLAALAAVLVGGR